MFSVYEKCCGVQSLDLEKIKKVQKIFGNNLEQTYKLIVAAIWLFYYVLLRL